MPCRRQLRMMIALPLAAVQAALLATAKGATLDGPALAPRELGGALVVSIEVGDVAKALLQPSPRHALLLQGAAGPIVMCTPEGDALRSLAVDPQHGLMTSRAFAVKLAANAFGVFRKLSGLAVPRSKRKAKGERPEATAGQLLQGMTVADVQAHVQLARSWCELASESSSSQEDLDALELETTHALEAGGPPLAPLLARWQQVAAAATPASADKPSAAADLDAAERFRVVVSTCLNAVRETDLATFAATHSQLAAHPGGSAGGTSVELRSLLDSLDPKGALPPEQIVFAVQCGSAMYNLATAASDEDYLLVCNHARNPHHNIP